MIDIIRKAGENGCFNEEVNQLYETNKAFYKMGATVKGQVFTLTPLSFFYCIFGESLKFENCVFEKEVEFRWSIVERVSFINCTFRDNVYFEDCKLGAVSFSNCTIDENVYITGSEVTFLTFEGTIAKKIKISDSSVKDLTAEGASKASSCDIIECLIDSIDISIKDPCFPVSIKGMYGNPHVCIKNPLNAIQGFRDDLRYNRQGAIEAYKPIWIRGRVYAVAVLTIPEDAKMFVYPNTVRVDKAIVKEIRGANDDLTTYKQGYTTSFCQDDMKNIVCKVGEMIEADEFDDNPYVPGGKGIEATLSWERARQKVLEYGDDTFLF